MKQKIKLPDDAYVEAFTGSGDPIENGFRIPAYPEKRMKQAIKILKDLKGLDFRVEDDVVKILNGTVTDPNDENELELEWDDEYSTKFNVYSMECLGATYIIAAFNEDQAFEIVLNDEKFLDSTGKLTGKKSDLNKIKDYTISGKKGIIYRYFNK